MNRIILLLLLSIPARMVAQQRIVVAGDGRGDFKTIQEAINSLPDSSASTRTIFIKKGTYKEKLFIKKHNLILEGEGRDQTIISYSIARDEWRCDHPDDWGVATMNIQANDITLKNLAVINHFGFTFSGDYTVPCKSDSTGKKTITTRSHQMALRTMYCTRLKAVNCHFKAFGGDTVSPWETGNGMWYFKDCIMEGGVDFYCPRGWAWAENCEFITHTGTAAIWHDGSANADSKTVLVNCSFKGFDGFSLGRYHRDAQFYLVNCVFARNMKDQPIYRVGAGNNIQWGERIYYYNCRREGGNDFAWHSNHLPAGLNAADISVKWVFGLRWDPEKKLIMQLAKNALGHIEAKQGLEKPAETLLALPEKVLQFGTGVLLRALPDYFIDKANKAGIFNGRVVVVKSTDSDSSAFDRQDGLYTVCVRGVENGVTVEENIINASVSRVLGAKTEWKKILECAHNPEMQIVLSNTTEVGIQLVDDDIHAEPPVSFPGKLLAFLLERYKAFQGTAESGMVIVPTELITDNGSKLESIVLELAHRNQLDFKFIEWLETANTFCNSLVDRIVPGKPNQIDGQKIQDALGYEDELMTMSEVFRLWAIEGDEKVKQVLSFHKADPGMVIVPDITLFKELKLRLLNGTHTFNCGTAFLSGFNITREAVTHPVYGAFTKRLMHEEIAPAIPFAIDEKVKADFANSVFERFCNPFIDHQWLSITVQVTSKMKMRNLPLLQQHFKNSSQLPVHMAAGFAAFLLYMKVTKQDGDKYFGTRGNESYEIKDDSAAYFYELWQNNDPASVAKLAMQNKDIWEADLTQFPGFLEAVQETLAAYLSGGVLETIEQIELKKEIA